MAVVLVVDDSVVDQKIAGGLLEANGLIDVRYASSGKEALQAISEQPPDLVLTDLQMPDLNGLQVVTRVVQETPHIPVVLMTAHGSENVAAQALAAGAASFVPKTSLAETLVDTVAQILVIAANDEKYRKLIGCATRNEFEFRLENDPDLIEPLKEMIQQIGLSQGLLDQVSEVKLGVAINHALSNAMLRGNLEIDRKEVPVASPDLIAQRTADPKFRDRRVHFCATLTPTSAKFTVRDEGDGFDTSIVPAPHDPESLEVGKGRGLVLIQSSMTSVTYNQQGNKVVMVFEKKS